MKILIDMNLAPRWAGLFSERDITAVHWRDVGALENVCPEELIDHIVRVLVRCASDIEQGALVTIGSRKTRVSLLPLV